MNELTREASRQTILEAISFFRAFIGLVVGAWWHSKPISELEKRAELDEFERDL